MYQALRNEESNILPQDARGRIEKDCIGIWSKRTILEALPAEAKNPEKQKAGRLSQKKRNFAAVSAAPVVEEIILDTDGRSSNIGAYPISDSINQHHDQSNQNGIGVDDNGETQTTATNQGKLVDYNEPKANIEPSASQPVAHKLLSNPSDKSACPHYCEFTISKDKYEMVRDAMNKSKTSILVRFDENNRFLSADPDVCSQIVFDNSEDNHQDGNVQRMQSNDVAKDEEQTESSEMDEKQKVENLAQIGYSNHAIS
ncbi:MAG: hypothetical protein WBZ36_14090 [Candidatus Nitrosopolaris sp.]